MKYFVWKKAFNSYFAGVIAFNVLLVPLIIWFAIYSTPFRYLIIFISILILFDIIAFYGLMILGSVVSLEDDVINCMFLTKVRRAIRYSELKEYGVFYNYTQHLCLVKFIYLSRTELSKNQRTKAMPYGMYLMNKDIIIVPYSDEIMELLKEKAPGVRVYELSW